MVYYLALAIPIFAVASGIYCLLFCSACEERRKQKAADAMQMKVARELQALARKEREAQDVPMGVLLMKKDGKYGT